ncbi:MAG: tight adherence protein, partial [Chloroflexia bacterium]|nr:tight adherence protein [Chloroflexia bacterium]
MDPLIAAAIGAIVVMALFFGLARLSAGSSDVKGRLSRFVGGEKAEEKKQEKKAFSLGIGDSIMAAKVEKSVGKGGYGKNIQRKLAQADLKLTLLEFMLAKVALLVLGLAVGAYLGRG